MDTIHQLYLGHQLRLGPQPLPLHLQTAVTTWLSCATGYQAWNKGLPIWHPTLATQAQKIQTDATHLQQQYDLQTDDILAAIDAEGRRRLDGFMRGVQAYRRHPWRRPLNDPPVIWQEGHSRLLDYGALIPPGQHLDTPPLLLVPSLINRAWILDLRPERSLIRWLANHGVRCLLLDWGHPDDVARHFTLTDYIAGRLERASKHIPTPFHLLGYCMGGMLATAFALRHPDKVNSLTLMATPWDFHGQNPASAQRFAASYIPMRPLIDQWGELPVDGVQTLFASLDPLLVPRKFLEFAHQHDPDAATSFVALEDWLNQGIPLAGAVARECLERWYGHNDPMRGQWRITGQAITPAAITCPTLAFIPQNDRIVPPESAEALANAIPGTTILRPPLGHIGLVVGRQAEIHVWTPLLNWLSSPGK